MPQTDKGFRAGLTALALAIALGPSAASAAERGYRLGPVQIEGSAPSRVVGGAGIISPLFSPGGSTSGAAGLEYRFGKKLLVFGPSIGVLGSTDLELYVGAGIYADIKLGSFVITPEVQGGYYSEGDGVDLGGPFAFHTIVDMMWELSSGTRLGARLSHLSNAGIYESNPGTESILLLASFPVDFLL